MSALLLQINFGAETCNVQRDEVTSSIELDFQQLFGYFARRGLIGLPV